MKTLKMLTLFHVLLLFFTLLFRTCICTNITVTRYENGDIVTGFQKNTSCPIGSSKLSNTNEFIETCICKNDTTTFHVFSNKTYGCYAQNDIHSGCSHFKGQSELIPLFTSEKSGNTTKAVVHGEISPDPGCRLTLHVSITASSWTNYSYTDVDTISANNDYLYLPSRSHKLQVDFTTSALDNIVGHLLVINIRCRSKTSCVLVKHGGKEHFTLPDTIITTVTTVRSSASTTPSVNINVVTSAPVNGTTVTNHNVTDSMTTSAASSTISTTPKSTSTTTQANKSTTEASTMTTTTKATTTTRKTTAETTKLTTTEAITTTKITTTAAKAPISKTTTAETSAPLTTRQSPSTSEETTLSNLPSTLSTTTKHIYQTTTAITSKKDESSSKPVLAIGVAIASATLLILLIIVLIVLKRYRKKKNPKLKDSRLTTPQMNSSPQVYDYAPVDEVRRYRAPPRRGSTIQGVNLAEIEKLPPIPDNEYTSLNLENQSTEDYGILNQKNKPHIINTNHSDPIYFETEPIYSVAEPTDESMSAVNTKNETDAPVDGNEPPIYFETVGDLYAKIEK